MCTGTLRLFPGGWVPMPPDPRGPCCPATFTAHSNFIHPESCFCFWAPRLWCLIPLFWLVLALRWGGGRIRFSLFRGALHTLGDVLWALVSPGSAPPDLCTAHHCEAHQMGFYGLCQQLCPHRHFSDHRGRRTNFPPNVSWVKIWPERRDPVRSLSHEQYIT